MLDPETTRFLKESIALLPSEGTAAAHAFYSRLFDLAPEARPLFQHDMKVQEQKLQDMLAWIIENLEHEHKVLTQLRDLGRKHSGYGAKIDHYAPVGSALVWMFRETLGERFTDEMEEAWIEAYTFISGEMERGARNAAEA